jgi:hypothetical protein
MQSWSPWMPSLGDRWMEAPVRIDDHPFDPLLSHFVAEILNKQPLLISGEEGLAHKGAEAGER